MTISKKNVVGFSLAFLIVGFSSDAYSINFDEIVSVDRDLGKKNLTNQYSKEFVGFIPYSINAINKNLLLKKEDPDKYWNEAILSKIESDLILLEDLALVEKSISDLTAEYAKLNTKQKTDLNLKLNKLTHLGFPLWKEDRLKALESYKQRYEQMKQEFENDKKTYQDSRAMYANKDANISH